MAEDDKTINEQGSHFPVVGIGASAGGIKALQEFFTHGPDESGMAFVVVIHLSPDNPSSLDQLLEKCTSMDVLQVTEKVKLKPDHIYVIAPDQQLSIRNNQLFTKREEDKNGHSTIDTLFRTLATARKKKAICLILSGAGNDGTLGLKAIKENGGVSMAQDPGEADHSSMPQNAIDSDLVDFVLSIKELAQKVADHREMLDEVNIPLQLKEFTDGEKAALEEIFTMVNANTDRDFTHYKRPSVLRRLERRLFVTGSPDISAYRDYLKNNEDEINELFKDLLISVTSFFRNPEAFDVLEEKIIPKLFENKDEDDQVRVWATACATGEEAYSLAILLHEYASTLDNPPEVKVFATDIDKAALRKARTGTYPESVSAEISQKRLERYFNYDDNHYLIREEIRDLVVFAVHDLLTDPPFSNQDLITCRNLLIYFNKKLQKEVLSLLHYSLRPETYLFLGLSGSTHKASDLFASVDKKYGIYKMRHTSNPEEHLPHTPLWKNMSSGKVSSEKDDKNGNGLNVSKSHYRLLARQYAPPSIIINENHEVFHASEGIDRYLQYSQGKPSRDIIKMVKPELRDSLQTILFEFEQSGKTSLNKQVNFKQNDQNKSLGLIVQSVQIPDFPEGYIQITFVPEKDGNESEDDTAEILRRDSLEEDQAIIKQLQRELEVNKEQLRLTKEKYETSNEELRASNEELKSMNEELQATTEELQTSKEELQSLNEELKNTNNKLEHKNKKLQKANNDLKNLMEATEVGIIFVDRELNIERYTSRVTDMFNIMPADEGRPLSHITHELDYDQLEEDARRVLDDLQTQKHIISASDDRWYIMRLRPYQTMKDEIEGVVFTFVDITQLKQATEKLKVQASHQQAVASLGLYALDEHNITSILDEIILLISAQLDIDYAGFFELQKGGDSLLLKSGTGWSKNNAANVRIDADQNKELGFALNTHQPVVIDDFEEEKHFSRSPFFSNHDINSGVITTIEGEDAQAYGILGVFTRRKHSFAEHVVSFLQVVTNLVGETIKRIRTEEKLQQANKELEQRVKERTKELNETNTELEEKIEERDRLQEEILEISENERWQIGQFLHDELGQPLVAIELLMQSISDELGKDESLTKEIKEIRKMVKEVHMNVRELSHDVTPIDVEHGEIKNAFEAEAENAETIYDFSCTFKMVNIIPEIIKNAFVATHLHRIAKEALKNAGVHGKASKVTMTLTSKEKDLILKIEDNGVGYEPDGEKGVGIKLMEYRAELIGGALDVRRLDEDDGGTVVTCTVPLERAKDEESFKKGRVKI